MNEKADGNSGRVSFRLPPEVARDFARAAKDEGLSPGRLAKKVVLASLFDEVNLEARLEGLQRALSALRDDVRNLCVLLLWDRHRELSKEEVQAYIDEALCPREEGP